MSLSRSRLISLLGTLLAMLALAPAAHASCGGDCDGDGHVVVSELVTAVNIALGIAPLSSCAAASGDGSTVTITDLVAAVNSALTGCAVPIVLSGICQRPGTLGESLRPCDDGTPVEAARCLDSNTDFSACLQDASGRISIGGGTVSGAGQFAISVESTAAPPGADIVFEAMLQDTGDIVIPYRAHYQLPALTPTPRAGTGSNAASVDALTVTIDPSSEGTLAIEVLRGALEEFSAAQTDQITTAVRQDAHAQYGSLSLACAAALGTGLAASFISQMITGSTLGSPSALAVDATGNVFVAGGGSNNVFRIMPDGEIQQIIKAGGDGDHSLSFPDALAVDAAGNVFVAGASSNNVFRITPAGVIGQLIDATGDGAGHALVFPDALAVDAAGDLLVLGGGSNNAFRIAPAGEIHQLIDATGDGTGHALAFPDAVAVDAAGNVFVAGAVSSNVFRIPPGSAILQIIDAMGDGAHALSFTSALAVDVAGNIFAAGAASNNVFAITSAGEIQQIIDAAGDNAAAALASPSALAVDARGNAFVAGRSSNNVFRVMPDGEIARIIDAAGDVAGDALLSPGALAVDSAGFVFVAGVGSDNAFRIPPMVNTPIATATVRFGTTPTPIVTKPVEKTGTPTHAQHGTPTRTKASGATATATTHMSPTPTPTQAMPQIQQIIGAQGRYFTSTARWWSRSRTIIASEEGYGSSGDDMPSRCGRFDSEILFE